MALIFLDITLVPSWPQKHKNNGINWISLNASTNLG